MTRAQSTRMQLPWTIQKSLMSASHSPLLDLGLDSAFTGIVVCDAAGTIVFVNPQIARTFGYPPDALVGTSIDDLLPSRHPQDAPRQTGVAAAFESESPRTSAHSAARHSDGSSLPVQVERTVLEPGDGPLTVLIIRNAGERAELRNRTARPAVEGDSFERLVSELATRFLTIRRQQMDEAITESLGRIAEMLDLDRGGWWHVPPDSEDAFITHAWTRAEYRVMQSGESAKAHVPWIFSRLQRGEVVAFSDTDSIPNAIDREGLRRFGTRSGAAVPFCADGRLKAILELSTIRRCREWPPEVIARLRLIAAVLGHALLRRESDERLQRAMEEVRQLRDQLAVENVQLRREVKVLGVPRIVVAESPAAKRVLEQIESVAPTAATVLLLGETGTGKEVFAQAIHRYSERHGRPMVTVSCAAIPSTLIESELFGRERGAYTGALARQIGRFEMAHDSTLFLDEIGELPLDAQVKLLRVLQEKVIERLGGGQPVKVNVRIIAATNRNLEKAVEERTFREDLFYRLNVFPISIPPLRQRIEDIPALVWTFIEEYSQAFRKPIESISKESLIALQRYSWPGNVRELRNVIERAVIVSKGPRLVVDLPVAAAAAMRTSMRLDDLETQQIKTVLESVGWRVRGPGGAAELLGIKPNTLDSRMAKLGILRPSRDTGRRN
jgi:PAS domain S-box-containing protein